MSLHTARLPARVDSAGDLNSLVHQGVELTAYHIEAAIAATHASARSLEDTDWPAIVSLYDRLMVVAPSPVVALNRAIAISQRDGAERGIEELHAIQDRDRLNAYPFYPAALGELELRLGNRDAAHQRFAAALGLARNLTERRFLEKRVQACLRLPSTPAKSVRSIHPSDSSKG